MMNSFLALNRNLKLLWLGQFISIAGDFLFQTGALFFAKQTAAGDSAAFKTGVTGALLMLPYLIFGPVAGAWVDRSNKRRLMLFCDVIRAVILLSMPLLYQAGVLNWLTLGLLGFVLSSFSALFNPARDAVTPLLAEGSELMRANAFIQSAMQFALIAGTLLAMAALAVEKSMGVAATAAILGLFVLDGISFLGSFVCIALIHAPAEQARGERRAIKHEVMDGLKYSANSPLLLSLLILTAINNLLIMGPASIGATLLVETTLKRGPETFAWLETGVGLGWIAGTFLLMRFGKDRSKGKLLLLGVFMDGVTFLPLLATLRWPSVALAFVVLSLHGVFIPLITVSRASIVHEYVPAAFQGRVFSLINLTVVGSMSVSSLLAGWIGGMVAPPILYLIAGAGGSISGALGFLVCRELRNRR